MADRDVFPTANFRWPSVRITASGGSSLGTIEGVPAGPGLVERPLDPLSPLELVTRDRDELVAALEKALRRCSEDSPNMVTLYADPCEDCRAAQALLARIKAGG